MDALVTGPEHYREAERMLLVAQSEMEGYAFTRDEAAEAVHLAQAQWAQQRAQVHATLALAAATVEAVGIAPGDRLALRPLPADDFPGGDPAYPGNPWGRALYGEVTS